MLRILSEWRNMRAQAKRRSIMQVCYKNIKLSSELFKVLWRTQNGSSMALLELLEEFRSFLSSTEVFIL